jgi:hypothetical protein
MNGSDNIDQVLVTHSPADAAAAESATVVDGVAAIDGAARDLGLKSVRAWVPDTTDKQRSAGTERALRHRERKEHDGMKQISVMLPSDLHPALRELAKRTRGGEPVDAVLRDMFPAPPVTTPAVPAAPAMPAAPTLPAAPATAATPIMPTPRAAPTAPVTPAKPAAPPAPDAPSFEAWLETLLARLPAWRQWLVRWLLPPLASH